MNNYLVPVSTDFIEEVAKAIARSRMRRDMESTLEEMIGYRPGILESLDKVFDETVFERIWAGTTPTDIAQKDSYRFDAISAIQFINLKLLVT